MPEELIAQFRILRKLGEGGMGEVYLAQDTKLDRTVALKLLRSEFASDQGRLSRFLREAQAASALDHASITHIYEVGQANGTHFIAMQYVEGQTLEQQIETKPLGVQALLSLGIQIGEALQEAHSRGIIHRDLKPANVIVGPRGHVKVLDFGLAKIAAGAALDSNINEMPTILNTEPGMVVGTIQYMSPEQALGRTLDGRSDIFSLGILLYQAITGHHPFPGKTVMQVFNGIVNKEPEPPSEYRSLVSYELENIILKCLAKTPEARYQTSGELVTDLKALQQDTNSAKRTTKPRRLAPRPAVFAVRIVVVLLLVLTVVAGSVYFGSMEKRNIQSVAVLPFSNTSRLADTEYLSDGITDVTINSLSRIPGLKVLARGTVFAYKGKDSDPRLLGKELRVDAIVSGNIYQQKDDLSIHVNLVTTNDGVQIWGRQYLRKASDIQNIQAEISREISSELASRLAQKKGVLQSASTRTSSGEAYHSYLRGLYQWNKRTGESLQSAGEYYRDAIDKDPNYAQAWAGLANTYVLLSIYGVLPPTQAIPQAEEYARKALELDDSIAEAHAALGVATMVLKTDWAGAESEFRKALSLNPNYATAHHWYGSSLLADQGKFPEADREMKRALDLDPLSMIINSDTANTWLLARNYDRAVAQFRKTLEMDPGFYSARIYLGQTLAFQGKMEEAETELLMARKLDDDPFITASLGYVYAKSGRPEKAMECLAQLDELSAHRYVSPYFKAVVHAALGNADAAFAALDQALDEHSEFALYLKVDPLMDDLRKDPRFPARIQRLHLSPAEDRR